MRKKITLFTLSLLALSSAVSQTLNNSFETWRTESYTFDASGLGLPLPPETYNHNDMEDWTTSNQLTKAGILGGNELVTREATNVYDGTYAAKLSTTLLSIPFVGDFTVPGLVISGEFKLEIDVIANIFTGGGGLDFYTIPNTGQPISTRPQSIVGYADYTRAGTDQAWIFSSLVRNTGDGRELIATAEYIINTNTSGYEFFEVNYTYFSCATPDTVVTFISSSYIDPNTTSTGTPGSVLFVDSFGVSGTAPLLPPVLNDDNTETFINESVVIDVLNNDSFCDGDNETPVIVTPSGGTTSVNANNQIVYTPFLDFTGVDEFVYEICNPQGCSQATVTIIVSPYPECFANIISRIVTGNVTDVFDAATVDCDNTTLTISSPASNGTAAVVGGQLSYTPNTDYLGSDQFSYSACSPFITTQCDEADVFITVLTSINRLNPSIISVFPNPAKDMLFVTLNSNDNVNLKLIDVTGKLVFENNFVNETSVSLNNTSNGMYILKLETKDGIATQKVQIVK